MRDRYRGALLGLAAGDALGTTVEFKAPGAFEPLTEIVGGGVFNVPPGAWTDDTSMALCLAESLIECSGFNPLDQLERYLDWYRNGHLSSTGRCFDIGNTVRAALHRFEQTREPYCGPTDPHTAGNGSLMRLAPVPLFFAADPEAAIRYAAASSRTTHAAAAAVDSCRYFAALLIGALSGVDKSTLLDPERSPILGIWENEPLHPEVADVAGGTFLRRQPPEIRGAGYVVRTLEAALWAFARNDSFAAGALAAVNLGDDADTVGAVYGQLAGAHYGEQGISESWRKRLTAHEAIGNYADRLLEVASPQFR